MKVREETREERVSDWVVALRANRLLHADRLRAAGGCVESFCDWERNPE